MKIEEKKNEVEMIGENYRLLVIEIVERLQ